MYYLIKKIGWSNEDLADDGNKFLIGNGYMGVRGSLEEDGPDRLVAVNLAGIYDQVGDGWREPLNAPNPFYTKVYVCDEILDISSKVVSHEQRLNFRYGLRSRRTKWHHQGLEIMVAADRFVSMDQVHEMGLRYQVTANRDLSLKILASIDEEVWDIHGPHYDKVEISQLNEQDILAHAYVQKSKKEVLVGRKNRFFIKRLVSQNANQDQTFEPCREAKDFLWESVNPRCLTRLDGDTDTEQIGLYEVRLRAKETLVVESLALIYTTNDTSQPRQALITHLSALTNQNFMGMYEASQEKWDQIWAASQIVIEGDEEAETALNYSLYHLNCAAPAHQEGLSIPARALSGQTYKGAVFWDTEVFMLDYFLHARPGVARSLVKYRINTLEGALKKAAAYGLKGAFYAWESQEGGFDACSDYNVTDVFTARPIRTYFKDKQVHISAAIVYAIDRYVHSTGDESILSESGYRVIFEAAKFYWSLLSRPNKTGRLELHDVIGPDEYHERVNNNAYTNRMAIYTFERAISLYKRSYDKDLGLDVSLWLDRFTEARDQLFMPTPNQAGIIEQFDGYHDLEDIGPREVKARLKDPREYWGGGSGVASDTQVIKQADVITLLELFHMDYPKKVLEANWHHYEPRTEHGSSLSACMYAMVACRIQRPDLAYPFFMKSATAEIRGGGKQWAGLVYIGGTHPAAAGGAWKNLVFGFAGLRENEGVISVQPSLPSHWKRVTFPYTYLGKSYQINLTQESQSIEPFL